MNINRFSAPPEIASQNTIVIDRVSPREFRVTASGLWSPDYIDKHFIRLKVVLAASRISDGVLVLVDLRSAGVQTAVTAERIRYWTSTVYESTDRVAILVASSLLGMQMRRVAIVANREIFTSEPEAIAWLRPSAEVA